MTTAHEQAIATGKSLKGGPIEDWWTMPFGKDQRVCVWGTFLGRDIRTSFIVKMADDKSWVETNNSIYPLGRKAQLRSAAE